MNIPQRFATRPSKLLPWADPTIARLVTKLQNEVRDERGSCRLQAFGGRTERLDLDPPTPQTDADWEAVDDSRWGPRDDSWTEL